MKTKTKMKNSNVKTVSELLKDQNEFVRKMAELTCMIFEMRGIGTDFVSYPFFASALNDTLKRKGSLYDGLNLAYTTVDDFAYRTLAFLLTHDPDDDDEFCDTNEMGNLLNADEFIKAFNALLYFNSPNRHKWFLSTLHFTLTCVIRTSKMVNSEIFVELIKNLVEPDDIGYDHFRK